MRICDFERIHTLASANYGTTEYFNQNNMVLPAPENIETVGTVCLDYSLYYFIDKILPLLHTVKE